MATMTAIQTVTVGAGGAANISFTNIPQTYTDLCILVSSRKSLSTTLGYTSINFNGDSGSNYGYVFLNGAGTGIYQNLTSPSTFLFFSSDDQGSTANTFGNTSIYIPNYVSNTGFKSVYTHCVSENNSAANAYMDIHSGIWRSTSSITSIVLADTLTSSSFVQYSTATLYGVFRGPEVKPTTPTIGTATAGSSSASVTFTPTSATNVDASYTLLSTPGSITASGTSSPITITGLTNGTAYTFQVRANNPSGSTAYSSASNSVTPFTPVAFRLFYTGEGRGTTVYYNDAVGGNWVTSGTAMPLGGALGSSSKIKPNSNRMYFWGNDGSPNNRVYSTSYTDGSWRAENNLASVGDWAMGTYLNTSGYLIGVGGYTNGNVVNRGAVNAGTGAVTWDNPSTYPVYASAPAAESLLNKMLVMGGFTSPSLSARRTDVYSTTNGASWTGETSLPFTPAGGYPTSASLIGAAEARVYVANGATLYSRGDSSGTWRSETSLPAGNYAIGSGVYNSTTLNGTLQFAGAGGMFYQTIAANGVIPTLGSWTTNSNTIGGDTSAYRGWVTSA
jgi:large repetitive protein